jgi:hypothetical protein
MGIQIKVIAGDAFLCLEVKILVVEARNTIRSIEKRGCQWAC